MVHEAKDGGRFERAAIIAMEDEWTALRGDVFAEISALQKGVGVVGVFFGEDFGADDFAAVEVEEILEFGKLGGCDRFDGFEKGFKLCDVGTGGGIVLGGEALDALANGGGTGCRT